MSFRIRRLTIYPVKSFRGIDLPSATLTRTGLAWDRHWLVIDDASGRFLGQRDFPEMATIDARLDDRMLTLSRDGHGACSVPLDVLRENCRVTEVWGDRCEVVDQGDEIAAWLSGALGQTAELRLVRMAPGYRRPQKSPQRYGEDTTTCFADTAPFLVASLATLRALNDALEADGKAPVPMERFRPNVVIEGPAAFEEHRLTRLEGPGWALGLRYPRERCVVTTIDQRSGERDAHGEPFRTLRHLNPMPESPHGPAFAELAVLEAGNGATIRVGDRFEAIS